MPVPLVVCEWWSTPAGSLWVRPRGGSDWREGGQRWNLGVGWWPRPFCWREDQDVGEGLQAWLWVRGLLQGGSVGVAALFERRIFLPHLLGALAEVQASQQGCVAGRGQRALGEGGGCSGSVFGQLLLRVLSLRAGVAAALLLEEDLVALCVR